MNALKSSAFLVLLACTTVPAGAQQIRSSYRFVEESQSAGIWAGYIAASQGQLGLGPNAGPVAGGRYTIRLSGPFNVEVEVGYFPTTRAVRDTVEVDSVFTKVGEADVGLLLANAALRFNLTGPRTWHNLQPYFAFGAGLAVGLTGENGDDDKLEADVRYDFGTSFAGQLGGGVEWYASRRMAVRFDARNVLWKLRTPAPFLAHDPSGRTPPDEWGQNGLFSLGLMLHF